MKKSWLKKQFTLKSINKKVFMLSKIIAIIIIALYFISKEYLPKINLATGLVIAIVIILMLILDKILYKMIVEPIKKLEKSAKKMSDLDFSNYCDIHSNDEFKSLGDNLNKMADNLQSALSELEKSNVQLEREVDRRELLLNQRKDLIDQLAHQMKTPLGVIKSYAEGAKDSNSEEKTQKYLDTIIEANDELTNLINTLLDLSAIESETAKFLREDFDFVELVETLLGQYLIDIPNQSYEIRYKLPDGKIFVHLDKMRMKQVIINLMNNAKNHVSDFGTIDLEINTFKDLISFSIYNTGEPIPEDVGGQIWEKFYKVNKGKSGSGLGLTIVSQILKTENIDYGYLNRRDGVEFYFNIPIKFKRNG
ncbi:MAG: HAMP domain-containing sensor histidine kinase [Tissierellia bacterium]|nr:HAMP domain-containing sensor histidine kinase [Tissierellia bacterium]